MPTEEQLSRVIRQGDPLGGNFEMNYSRGGQRFLLEHGRHCLLDSLRPGQRFHVHGEQVQNIAGWKKRRSRKFDRNYINYNITRERKERKEKSIQGEDRSSDSFRISIYLHPARAVAACCSSLANQGLWPQLPVLGAGAGTVEPSPSSCAGKPTPTTSWKPARSRIPSIWRLSRWARLKSAWPARWTGLWDCWARLEVGSPPSGRVQTPPGTNCCPGRRTYPAPRPSASRSLRNVNQQMLINIINLPPQQFAIVLSSTSSSDVYI